MGSRYFESVYFKLDILYSVKENQHLTPPRHQKERIPPPVGIPPHAQHIYQDILPSKPNHHNIHLYLLKIQRWPKQKRPQIPKYTLQCQE